MRFFIFILFLAQLAVHQSLTRPISRTSISTFSDYNVELNPVIAKSNLPILNRDEDATLLKRAPPPRRTPKAMEPMSLKEAHGKMIKANAISAARETGAGFTGAFKTVGYGFQQGYRHVKQAYHQFGKGNYRQGFGHMGKSVGKMAGGVALAPVPLAAGLYTGAKRTSHVLQHTYKYMSTSRAKTTSISPTDIRTIEAQLKYNTPTRDWSKKYVQNKLKYIPPS